jgi:hypothetical protein
LSEATWFKKQKKKDARFKKPYFHNFNNFLILLARHPNLGLARKQKQYLHQSFKIEQKLSDKILTIEKLN